MERANLSPDAWVFAGLYEGKRRKVQQRVEQQKNVPRIAMSAVCTSFNVTPEEVIGRTRIQRVAFARHAFCSMVRKFTRMTLREIGEYLGGRDHATILNGVNVSENLLRYDPQFQQSYDEALELLIEECGLLSHMRPRS